MGKKSSTTTPAFVFLLLLVCTLLASLLSSRPVALADDTSLGATGGTVYPVKSADVRLDAETVQATCFGEFVEYRVDFRFVNDGAARTIRLGFPFDYADYRENDSEPPVGFQAWQDGDPLQVRVVPARPVDGGEEGGYFVHVARFPRGATTITVSYLTQYSSSAMGRRAGADWGDPGFGMASWCEYWLHTGSTWKGPIGEAVVRYRFADSFDGLDIELTSAETDPAVEDVGEGVPVTAPDGWTTPLPRAYQWRFRDFEPLLDDDAEWWQPQSDYDVMLGFGGPMKLGVTQGKWSWSSVASSGDPDDAAYGGIQNGDLGSCWAEGVPGAGEDEWIEARFKKVRHLRELRILPGNNAYLAAFTKYGRPKVLNAVFDDGTSATLRLRDAPALQRFPVDVTTRTVRLVVESVYLGTDYPGTCISEVEFGTEEAPGYASFADLMADDAATGRLPSWAGPAAPAPQQPARNVERREESDAEAVACGDLIGVDQWEPFPADDTPFKEPAKLTDIAESGKDVPLPGEELVGKPVEVYALSYWTYEIRYSAEIDLLVNTALSRVPSTSVLADLREEARGGCPYEDGRALPYDAQSIGDCVVGVARPGVIAEECAFPGESGEVPGQVFWRDGELSYHLYARSQDVTIHKLVEVATSIIDPKLLETATTADAGAPANKTARGWLVVLVAVGIAAVAFVLVARRRKAAASSAD
jgi:hypothetical protein